MKRTKLTVKYPGANRDILAQFAQLEVEELAMGWFADGGDAATIATYNHFGSPAANIPPRDAVTPATQAASNAVQDAAVDAGRSAARGRDPRGDLDGAVITLQDELKRAVREFSNPPNARSTIRGKGFDDPLIGAGSDGGRILRWAGARRRRR